MLLLTLYLLYPCLYLLQVVLLEGPLDRVAPDLQGQGIGSRMMEFYCSKVDETAMAAYHETDRPENVDFYKKFGFEVISEEFLDAGIPHKRMSRSL